MSDDMQRARRNGAIIRALAALAHASHSECVGDEQGDMLRQLVCEAREQYDAIRAGEREAREQAWDEGYDMGTLDGAERAGMHDNPYRIEKPRIGPGDCTVCGKRVQRRYPDGTCGICGL